MMWWKQNKATSLSLSPPHGAVGNSRFCCSEPHSFRFLHLRRRPQPKSTEALGGCNGTFEGDSNASQCFGVYYHTRGVKIFIKFSRRQQSGANTRLQIRPIRHFSPSEIKLASASTLSSFMVRKIKCQTHLSLVSRPLPTSTLQPADWAPSHPPPL